LAYALATAGFLVGLPINVFILPMAFLVSIGLMLFWARRGKIKSPKWLILLFLAFLFIIPLISGLFYDVTADGQGYHQSAVIRMSQGWNPIHKVLGTDYPNYFWNNHYPKFAEVFEACICNLTQQIEMAKCLNIFLIIASFLMSLGVLLRTESLSLRKGAVYSFLLAFNPVSVYQSLSFYVDGIMASLLLIFLWAVLLLVRGEEKIYGYSVFFAAACLIINVKFTGLVFVAAIVFGALLLLLFRRKTQEFFKLAGASFLIIVISVAVFGYNPYITNLRSEKHIFYPVLGKDRIEPGYPLRDKNPSERLILSLLSESSSHSYPENLKVHLKLPFIIKPSEIYALRGPDPQFAGWGAFFALILISSMYFLFKKRLYHSRYFSLIFFVGLSVVVNPECYWARFNPQFWFIPIFILIIVEQIFLSRGEALLLKLQKLFVLVNIGLIVAMYLSFNLAKTYLVENELRTIKARNQPVTLYLKDNVFESLLIKFEKKHIPYRLASEAEYLRDKDKFQPFQYIFRTHNFFKY
jgi:4-amino-4-deoxy-L-arabinose transferase-like glycosyltransferase